MLWRGCSGIQQNIPTRIPPFGKGAAPLSVTYLQSKLSGNRVETAWKPSGNHVETKWKLHRQLCPTVPPPPVAFSIFHFHFHFHIPFIPFPYSISMLHFSKQESEKSSQIPLIPKGELGMLAALPRPLSEQSLCKQGCVNSASRQVLVFSTNGNYVL